MSDSGVFIIVTDYPIVKYVEPLDLEEWEVTLQACLG